LTKILLCICQQAGVPQEQQTDAEHEVVEVDPLRLQFEKQLLSRATEDKGFDLKYSVPWDIW
jgi:hypothetical protein